MSFSIEDRDKELCRNIVEAFHFLESYIDGFGPSEFFSDHKTQDAVAMRLQQVLESASKLSIRVKTSLDLDWSSLIAMRNKISHSYVDVDAEIVWEVIAEFDEFTQLIAWAKLNV